MTNDEFVKLSADLRELARIVPLRWGAVQNNEYDGLVDMFRLDTFAELEVAIKSLDENVKQYFRRRWYMWKCAQCDEHIFCENDGVVPNPNSKDQGWDIDIAGVVRFDIKGTVVPREMRGNIETLLRDPSPMIAFYYERQSQGVRYCIQNRLFVVHHSFVAKEREFYLRCAWGVKKRAYGAFCANINSVRVFPYKGCEAAVIFILEKERGKAEFVIP